MFIRTHQEEERDAGATRRMGQSASTIGKAQQDGDHHHRDGAAERAPHHRPASSHLIEEERGQERADEEHGVDGATEDEREVAVEADIDLQHRGHVVSVAISAVTRPLASRIVTTSGQENCSDKLTQPG